MGLSFDPDALISIEHINYHICYSNFSHHRWVSQEEFDMVLYTVTREPYSRHVTIIKWQLVHFFCISFHTTGAVLDRIFIFVVSNPSILPIWPLAANFVVITNGGGARSLEQPISTNSVPRAFFPRVAIGCRLLGGVLIGGYMR